ncbi:MAG: hypothetical protein MZU79_06085 [Anaerotruncus sp.]|nr:hypothetical protein [Anaerotruncus sp.]
MARKAIAFMMGARRRGQDLDDVPRARRRQAQYPDRDGCQLHREHDRRRGRPDGVASRRQRCDRRKRLSLGEPASPSTSCSTTTTTACSARRTRLGPVRVESRGRLVLRGKNGTGPDLLPDPPGTPYRAGLVAWPSESGNKPWTIGSPALIMCSSGRPLDSRKCLPGRRDFEIFKSGSADAIRSGRKEGSMIHRLAGL